MSRSGSANLSPALNVLSKTARVSRLRILMRTRVCPPRAVGRETSTSIVWYGAPSNSKNIFRLISIASISAAITVYCSVPDARPARDRGSPQALPDGRLARARARRRVDRRAAGRVRRPAGHVRVREIDAPQPHRGPRPPDSRRPPHLRSGPLEDVERAAERPSPEERRHHLPVVQPRLDDERLRERQPGDDVRRRAARRARGEGVEPPRKRGPGRPAAASAARALRRRAAAGRHRAGALQRSPPAPGRRADRQSRQPDDARHHVAAQGAQRARRQDDHHGDARSRPRARVRAPDDHDAGRCGGGIVTFRDTLGLALRNLGQAKLRTSLTTLGVSIGIASLAGMVSLGVGLQDQFVERFTKSGMFDAITVMPGGDLPGFAAGGRGRGQFGRRGFGKNPSTAVENARDINDAALAELAAMTGVRTVYPSIRGPVEVKYGGTSEFAQAVGVPVVLRGEGAFQSIPYGRFFTSDTEEACMLSLDYAKRINEQNPGSLIGQELTLNYAVATRGGQPGIAMPGNPVTAGAAGISVQRAEVKCPIVGIVERETGPFAAAGGVAGLMVPMGKAKALYDGSPAVAAALLRDPARKSVNYTSAVVRVIAASQTQDVEDQIKKMGFQAFSLNDALQGAKRGFIILDIVLSLIGSIALAVSSLGIMNTMVMSILERTREIGIMKAIGGSDADIRRIFLIEASSIGLLGGCAGIVLGWSVGRIINFGANLYIERQGGTAGHLFALPFWLIGGAIVFSVVVSLIAGSYPAARAARLDPIQALRHD